MTYNPDLDGAMGGSSFNATVTTGSAILVQQSTASNRRGVILVNRDATNPIYYNYGKNVTAASTANASLKAGESIRLNLRCAIYAIATGGSVSVDVSTEEDY